MEWRISRSNAGQNAMDTSFDCRLIVVFDLEATCDGDGRMRPVEMETIESLALLPDHALLKDYDVDWDDGGERYSKPEWTAAASHPVTHSMGEHVTVAIELWVEPQDCTPEVATLRGTGPDGLTFKKERVQLTGGALRLELMTSMPLRRKVQELAFAVTWQLDGASVQVAPPTTRNKIFVTMNTPATPDRRPGITLKRMRHAVKQASQAPRADTHEIAETIMKRWPDYNPRYHRPNAWSVADIIKGGDRRSTGVDCQSIVRYTENVLRMVGCPGEFAFVVVWASVPSPSEPIENPAYVPNLSTPPQWYNDHRAYDASRSDWLATLVDSGGVHNRYEACLLVSADGASSYYAGGVGRIGSAYKVLHAFTSMSWRNDATGTTEEVIYEY